jgi:hypothetical protein
MSNTQVGIFIFGSMLLVLGTMFLLISVLLAFFDKPGSGYAISSGTISLIFAVVFWLCSQGDTKEAVFKLGNLQAQITRSEQVIQQANATIDQIKEVAGTFAEPTFTNLALSGNMLVGITADQKVTYREQLAQSLRKLGLSTADIDNAAHNFDEMFDCYHKVKFYASLTDDAKRTLQEEGLTPKKVRQSGLVLSPESEEFLKDWEFYQKNRQLRRPELWRYHAGS